ncbi:hypothetical protein [Galbibacter pacificus]|uniref:Uncharacterized protein n=1 Tax=Galbibacter pacificus TaxID=2996052 RepID=A0ABT6FM41_9FLAO|nr:hypothetical protein [Galbibacter pacificus]MDG3580847.1 hypothetical protein [Galbibacter pacificus]MDG3584325.1 hypothetical protein [Galbibacter pacificus]
MSDFDAKTHWEDIYKTKKPDQVSWFQDVPKTYTALLYGNKMRHHYKQFLLKISKKSISVTITIPPPSIQCKTLFFATSRNVNQF